MVLFEWYFALFSSEKTSMQRRAERELVRLERMRKRGQILEPPPISTDIPSSATPSSEGSFPGTKE